MTHNRTVDIIVTVGPQSWGEAPLRALLECGISAFRFPFSKETPEHHGEVLHRLRRIAIELGVQVEAIVDLPGGKPRLNNRQPVAIFGGRRYSVSSIGEAVRLADFVVTPALQEPFRVGQSFAVADGALTFTIESVQDDTAVGVFDIDAVLQPTRGFMPLGDASFECMTAYDKVLAGAAHRFGFDSVALSFVSSAAELTAARSWLQQQLGWSPQLVAKIETPRGVANAADIAAVADQVMVARGDLAITAGFPGLWTSQLEIMSACAKANRYLIVATGLLECGDRPLAMSHSHSVDIAVSVYMGANALMLSGETTIGSEPVRAVELLRAHIDAVRDVRQSWPYATGSQASPR